MKMQTVLKMNGLSVCVDDKIILDEIQLTVKEGEVHVIMGPNGSGKTTLSKVIAGHPDYVISKGELQYLGEDLASLEVQQRAQKGIFLTYQSPIEVPGVNNAEFLRMIYNNKAKIDGRDEIDPMDFDVLLDEKMQLLGLGDEYKSRGLNQGFSGGERKKNEMLQMLMLEPKLCILDEIDSGLDIDALKIVSAVIRKNMSEKRSWIIITHFPRILNYVRANYVHVMQNGKIVASGGQQLAYQLEKHGYGSFDDN